MYKDPAKNKRLHRHATYQGDAFTAPCRCGCGDPVPLGYDGQKMYVNRTHRAWDYAYGPQADNILIADFRVAVRKLMAAKNMSIRELAVAGGLQPEGLGPYLYNARTKGVSRVWATDFFRRVAGLSATPSGYQRAQAEQSSTARTIREIGVDADSSGYKSPSLFWRPNLKKKNVSVALIGRAPAW